MALIWYAEDCVAPRPQFPPNPITLDSASLHHTAVRLPSCNILSPRHRAALSRFQLGLRWAALHRDIICCACPEGTSRHVSKREGVLKAKAALYAPRTASEPLPYTIVSTAGPYALEQR